MTKKLIYILITCTAVTPCAARTITVDDDGPADFTTIQAAVDDANDGDTILIKDGLYTGNGNRDIEVRDKSIAIKSENGPENCIIDCDGSPQEPHRAFDIRDGRDTKRTISGLTIKNGYAETGGAVRCRQCRVAFLDCVLTGNAAEQGAGLFCLAHNVEVVDCTFEYNAAGKEGGAIYSIGTGRIETTRCTIRANRAAEYGGGLYSKQDGWHTLSSCLIVANHAQSGGGICLDDGSYVDFAGSTVAWNTAENDGGGIFFKRPGHCGMINLILWGNAAHVDSGETAQVGGNWCGAAFSCIQDDDPDDDNIPQGNLNIDDDPMFVRVPYDGGDGWGVGDNDDFGDLHLQPTSPCIDAGQCMVYTNPDDLDIDREPRVMGSCVDMGADEFSPIFLVVRPAGSEVWAADSRHEIRWESLTFDATINIFLSTDGGQSWTLAAAAVPDTGTHIWDLPAGLSSGTCTVKVVPSAPELDFVSIQSGLFAIRPISVYPAVASKWPTQGASTRRAGTSEDAGPHLGCVKWQFETDGAVIGSVTVGPHGRVHVACESGRLYTLDSDGNLLWTYDANTPLLSSPTVGPDGSLYVGAENGTLFAVDSNGNLRWRHSTEAQLYASPAVSPNGNVYAGSLDGVLYALAPDGSELWSLPFKGLGRNARGSIVAPPSIGDDGTLYVGSIYDPNLYALDPTDGGVRWTCSFVQPADPCDPNSEAESGWLLTAPVVAPSGAIYQTLVHDSHLYAIDGNEGGILWATDLADPGSGFFDPNYAEDYTGPDGWSEPAIGPDGTIYASLDDPYLRAVSPDGEILWVTKLGAVGAFLLTVDSDGYIYAASDDGDLCVVSPDGVEVSRFQTDGWPGYPVIAGPDTIIASDTRGYSVMMPDAHNIVTAITTSDCDHKPLVLNWPEDLDGSGIVDWPDIELLASQWLECTTFVYEPFQSSTCDYADGRAYPDADMDKDMTVDFADWAIFAARWLDGSP